MVNQSAWLRIDLERYGLTSPLFGWMEIAASAGFARHISKAPFQHRVAIVTQPSSPRRRSQFDNCWTKNSASSPGTHASQPRPTAAGATFVWIASDRSRHSAPGTGSKKCADVCPDRVKVCLVAWCDHQVVVRGPAGVGRVPRLQHGDASFR